jgi:hypothetical protein
VSFPTRSATELPVTITWQWIEGHQDNHRPYHTLSSLAQDNVQADQIAEFKLNRCGRQGFAPSSQRFADEGWSISLRGRKLSKLDFHQLYASMWAGTALDYWATKHDLPFTTVLSIDWDTHGEALQSLSFGPRRRVVKHASGHFGVGSVLKKWGAQDHSECPRCQQHETPSHVLSCKAPSAVNVWETSLTKLDTWMEKKHTNPDLRSAILQRLREWQLGRPISPPSWNCSFKKALKAQNSIGWYPLLLGHVSNSWRDVQQAYYTSLGLDNTGKQWVKQLILQLFNISWDMWEHRNGIKHNTIHPAKAREIQQLDLRIHDE